MDAAAAAAVSYDVCRPRVARVLMVVDSFTVGILFFFAGWFRGARFRS